MSKLQVTPGVLALGALVICGVALTGMNVVTYHAEREQHFASWTPVANWRDYAVSGIRVGPDSARVTVVEFGDYACDPCRKMAPELLAAVARFPGDVTVVLHQLPFEGPRSDSAAAGAYCAMDQGRFREFDLALVETKALSSKGIAEYAQAAGIHDVEQFMTCISSERAKQAIVLDKQQAKKLGLHTVPLLLINDKEFLLPPALVIEAVTRELKATPPGQTR